MAKIKNYWLRIDATVKARNLEKALKHLRKKIKNNKKIAFGEPVYMGAVNI